MGLDLVVVVVVVEWIPQPNQVEKDTIPGEPVTENRVNNTKISLEPKSEDLLNEVLIKNNEYLELEMSLVMALKIEEEVLRTKLENIIKKAMQRDTPRVGR